ncbi:MAG TPA: hypothetical protein VMZ03_06965 [Chitinophagaceae bacterium]|nr:hypothetical protein [Chitinophagaceae bacterium]
MKKVIKIVETNIWSFLGDETIQDRPTSFRIVAGTLVLGTSAFIVYNIIRLFL